MPGNADLLDCQGQPQPPPLRSGKHTTIAQQESGHRLSCVRSLVQSQLVALKAVIPGRNRGTKIRKQLPDCSRSCFGIKAYR